MTVLAEFSKQGWIGGEAMVREMAVITVCIDSRV
jgi:hypothetical protein